MEVNNSYVWKKTYYTLRKIGEQFYECITDVTNTADVKETLIPIINPFEGKCIDTIAVAPTQSGKTQYIIDSVKGVLSRNLIPIVIASENIAVADQFVTRSQGQFVNDPFVITTTTPIDAILRPTQVFVTILHLGRMKKVLEMIQEGVRHGKGFVIYYDEADTAVKDESRCIEKIQKQINTEYGNFIVNVNITATAFAVYNSKWRNERKAIIEQLDINKEGFVYRDYFNCFHATTDIFAEIAETSKNEEFSCVNFGDYLYRQLSMPVDERANPQPNICLLKIFHDNYRKYKFAETLSVYIPNFYFVVYTGEGCFLYRNGQLSESWKAGICIGNIIQNMKNSSTTCPIVIISDRLAARSQTFKSADHEWVLTHMFMNIREKASVESIVQSLRFTGQYKVDQPICRVYRSDTTHNRIWKALYNNLILNEGITNQVFQNLSHRERITNIPFYNDGEIQKFSNRKGVDDTRVIQTKDDFIIEYEQDAVNNSALLAGLNNCNGIVWVTERLPDLPRNLYIDLLERCGNESDKDQYLTGEPYKNLSGGFQSKLRKTIKEHFPDHVKRDLRQLDILKPGNPALKDNGECQIAYVETRREQLDKIHHEKHKDYKAFVLVSLDPNDKGKISPIAYKLDYILNPSAYYNKVLCRHGLDGKVHLKVYKDGPINGFAHLAHY